MQVRTMHLLAIIIMGVARKSPLLTKCCFMYVENASYVKAHIINTAGPIAQLHVSALFWCKVRACKTFIGILNSEGRMLACAWVHYICKF